MGHLFPTPYLICVYPRPLSWSQGAFVQHVKWHPVSQEINQGKLLGARAWLVVGRQRQSKATWKKSMFQRVLLTCQRGAVCLVPNFQTVQAETEI